MTTANNPFIAEILRESGSIDKGIAQIALANTSRHTLDIPEVLTESGPTETALRCILDGHTTIEEIIQHT